MSILEVCVYEPTRPVLAEWSQEVGWRGGVVSLTGRSALSFVEPRLLSKQIDLVQLSGGVIHDSIWWFALQMVNRGIPVAVVADQIIFDDENLAMDDRTPAERYEKVLFFGGNRLRNADKKGSIRQVLSSVQ